MRSIWQETARLPRFPQLSGDICTDVLIIGGGMAGILTAYFLHKNGVRYALVEKDRICSGTTGNTTAKITVQHGLCYHKLLQSGGAEAVRQYLSANQKAFEQYAALCRKLDCDYEIRDNYVYSVDDRRKLEDEVNALHRIGCQAEFCECPRLPLPTVGAVIGGSCANLRKLSIPKRGSDIDGRRRTA